MNTFQRDGFPTVMPYLMVPNADALLTFAINVFHAEEVECHRGESGKIMHASVRIGDSVIEFSEATERWGSSPAALHVYVEDVDATYAAAIAARAESLSEVADMEYGERSGGVKDPTGNTWFIATAKA